MPYQINSKYCSCCHYCRQECPVGAIDFHGTKYQIDPEKCIDCGRCAEVCNSSLITKIGEAEKVTPHDPVALSCDVLVAGAGAAGLIAAAKAASEGRDVILIEKEKKIGGACWLAGGYRTWYSETHRKFGITEDPRPALYEDFLKTVGEENVDPAMLRRIFDANGEMVDWLYEKCGLQDCFRVGKNPWGQTAVHINMPYNVDRPVRIDPTIGPGAMGSAWVLTMEKLCEKFGVRLLTGVGARDIVPGGDGQVRQVIAADAGGEYRINCRAFILATGAMTHNDALISRFKPEFVDNPENEPVQKFTPPGCTGDGVIMAERLGADLDFQNVRVAMFGPAHHPFPYPGLAITRSPYGLTVNRNGEAFSLGNGMVAGAEALMAQPGHCCYMIFDRNMVEKAVAFNRAGGGDRNGKDMFENWEAELAHAVELGTPVKMGGTIPELAAAMGCDPAVLQATVDEYNRTFDRPKAGGVEPPPGEGFMGMKLEPLPLQRGPYYAFFQKFFHENAVGGIATDSHCRVTRKGTPIPGLYAAGDTCRGIMVAGPLGVEYIEGVITALTSAVTLGYAAGDEAAAYTA